MSAIDLALSVEDEGWAALVDVEILARRAVQAALRRIAPDATRGEISLVLGSDQAVQALNDQWRGKNQPTNVLSFPGQADPRAIPDEAPPPLMGDIILAWGVVSRQAAAEGKPLADHLQHLVVHGVLHLFGFDHETMSQAAEMEGLEREILAGLGVCDPYRNER